MIRLKNWWTCAFGGKHLKALTLCLTSGSTADVGPTSSTLLNADAMKPGAPRVGAMDDSRCQLSATRTHEFNDGDHDSTCVSK